MKISSVACGFSSVKIDYSDYIGSPYYGEKTSVGKMEKKLVSIHANYVPTCEVKTIGVDSKSENVLVPQN